MTPYPELDAVLREFVDGARDVLGDRFTAAYLLGSFALGDFDSHSDVDFLVVTETEVDDPRLRDLQRMHGRIHDLDSPWAKRLDGSYVARRIVRHADPARTPLLYLDNGSRALVRSDHCNTLVVRWVARERGIALAGPEPSSLIDPIPSDALRREACELMRRWADEIRADPAQMDNRWYQPYAVLSYCRMLYTLETATIASKPAAASWARRALGARWCPLIERALAQRPDPALRARQPADSADLASTHALIDYALGRAKIGRAEPS